MIFTKIRTLLIFVLLLNLQATAQTSTIIWSENFGNGIPATWTNAGTNAFGLPLANAVWAYRGPSTTPNNSIGSRGAYSGLQLPILSATDTNGFVIFDSDYLDNNGIVGNTGNGLAPAPHKSALTTPVINLALYPDVELKFTAYHRYFEGRALILLSTNGGITWSDTLVAHPGTAVNASTARNAAVSYNVSSIIGGQANARIQFLFDGTYDDPGASGAGRGYYFWMIDDIVLDVLQKHDIRFTEWNTAPKTDILYGPANGSSKMGFMVKNFYTDQTRDIIFDANAFNYGVDTIQNLKLKVDILNQFNTLVSSYQSANVAALAPTDTATFNVLNTYTTPWNPNAQGVYKIVYSLVSDSVQTVYPDTLRVVVSSSIMSTDYGVNSNQIGTSSLGNNGSAVASRLDFVQPATVEKMWIGLGAQTVAGGILEVRVFDSTNFDLITGYTSTGLKATLAPYTITAADVATGFAEIPFPTPLQVPANKGYYFAVYMYSNNGLNPITIRNDRTVNQSTMSKIMYIPNDFRWYTGYSSSRNLNSLWIRALLKDSVAISASGPINFCQGQSVILSIPAGLDSYLWNTGDTTNAILVDTSGSYSAIVSIDGVFDTLQPLVVTVYPNPTANFSIIQGGTSLCQGDTTLLEANFNATYAYQWLLNGNPIAGATSQTLAVVNAGDYAVRVTNATNCFKLSTDTTITLLPLPNTHVTLLGDTVFCTGDSLFLSAIFAPGNAYQWFLNGNILPGDTLPDFVAKVAGAYNVQILNAQGCMSTSTTTTVAVTPQVATSAITGPSLVNPALQYTYGVANTVGHTYTWTATNGFVIAGQGSSSVDVIWALGAIGTLAVVESNGLCTDSASLSIQIGIAVDEFLLKNERLTIYPNPANEAVHIRFNETKLPQAVTLNVLDAHGMLVLNTRVSVSENEFVLATAHLPSGLYMIVIPELEASVPLVVQH